MGTCGSAACSQMTKSSAHLLPGTLCHWPPMIGVATTFGGSGPAPHWRRPIGVCTERCFMVLATTFLFFGWPLALRSAAATSKRARLAPSCWFHSFPLDLVYPAPSCFEETAVREEVYGQVGAQ